MKYYVCTIGNFEEYSDQFKILKQCLRENFYELHRDARWPSPLGQIQKDDTLLLKIQNQLVAWGVATGPVHEHPPDYMEGWNRIVTVDGWHQYDKQAPANGVHHYGIQRATKAGAGQFAVVKEVEASWAKEKLEEFNGAPQPIVEDIGNSTRVTCRQQSLKELFGRPLHIPNYQRCFCWRKENIIDLLETLRTRISNGFGMDTPDTHLGAIILKEDDGKLAIVDGQQRLLTLTILGFRMRNEAWPLPLLKESFNGSSNEAASAQKHLRWAQVTIDEWLNTFCIQRIEDLLNQIQFSVITLPNEASEDLAYNFFNAVNSSGKKLSDYDLLKAHHLRFIGDESIAKCMAERWDATGAEGYDDVLNKTLYRLRMWSRYSDPVFNAQDGHSLFTHFSARVSSADGVFFTPLASQFNSAIHGGAPFFHYAEQYRLFWQDFQKTEACTALTMHLTGHSRDILRDCIGALLFLFYCKFGRSYLNDALFCIADVVSVLRNEDRIGSNKIRNPLFKECIYALDTSLDPGQFFDWCLLPERQYTPEKSGPTKQWYWISLNKLYTKLQSISIVLVKQSKQRAELFLTGDDQ